MRKFKEGDNAIITGCHNGHGFELGDHVKIISIVKGDYLAAKGGRRWYIQDEEAELIKRKSETQLHSTQPQPDRTMIAAMAMQGLSSNVEWGKTIIDDWDNYTDRLTDAAIEITDMLIKKLNKTP